MPRMVDVTDLLGPRFRSALATAFGPEHASADPLLRTAQSAQFGDFQANLAMGLAKQLGLKPREVAERLLRAFEWQGACAAPPEIAGPGFINLRLDGALLAELLLQMLADERLGAARAPCPETVVLDYSAPNVAKEMHVGHLRSTVIGDAIHRVLRFLGHRVVPQNHIGDWGTQFGMLIEHLAETGWRPGAGGDLTALYQAAKLRFDQDPSFAERARRRVVLLQGGDEATLSYWRSCIDESKRHFNAIYRRLGVLLTDTDICAESFYNDRLAPLVEELAARGLAVESKGAICVFPPGYLNPEKQPLPLIVRKSDGGYGYATTDLAALCYRTRELKADRVVYVIDARQSQHLAMVYAAGAMAGWLAPGGPRAEHVPFGTVLGEDNRPFKTRSGDTVKLADLLDEAEQRAFALVSDKSPDLPEPERRAIAAAVGIGAVKYADLANDRVKDYVFSWSRMLSFDGNTAPYLQNAYVRIRSIFRKGGLDPETARAGAEAAHLRIEHPAERSLALELLQFEPVLRSVAASLEPHRLCTWIYGVAAAYHRFYEACPVLTAKDAATARSRLLLSDLAARAIARGLELLGIATVEQM